MQSDVNPTDTSDDVRLPPNHEFEWSTRPLMMRSIGETGIVVPRNGGRHCAAIVIGLAWWDDGGSRHKNKRLVRVAIWADRMSAMPTATAYVVVNG